jgi:hypothetical protein
MNVGLFEWALKFALSGVCLLMLCVTGCKKPDAVKPPDNPAPVAQQEPVPEPPRPNLVKRTTNLVVDRTVAMAENPNLVDKVNKVSGSDPLTIALKGYVAISSQANVIAFQHNIDILKASEDRNPTFTEIQEFIKANNVTFNALPDYQWYAYDQETGTFSLLEDPVLKKKLREAAGLPPE